MPRYTFPSIHQTRILSFKKMATRSREDFSFETSFNPSNDSSMEDVIHSTPVPNNSGVRASSSIFHKNCSIIPTIERSQSEDEATAEATFWDQVVNLRDIMFEKREREDFDFSRKEILNFNRIAREKYGNLVRQIYIIQQKNNLLITCIFL